MLNIGQDGRLEQAYFLPNYKYFDQLLQTVKNKTTDLILVFKEFLQTSIRPLISVLYAKRYHDFPLKNLLSHSAEKRRRGTFLCFRKSLVSKNVRDKRGGGYHDFASKIFCLTVPKNFVEELFCAVFQKISGSEKILWIREGRGEYQNFPSKIFCLTVPEISVGGGNPLVFH